VLKHAQTCSNMLKHAHSVKSIRCFQSYYRTQKSKLPLKVLQNTARSVIPTITMSLFIGKHLKIVKVGESLGEACSYVRSYKPAMGGFGYF